jgi:hypothetical protein
MQMTACTEVHRACCRTASEDTLTAVFVRAAMGNDRRKDSGNPVAACWHCVAERVSDPVLRLVEELMARPVVSHDQSGA